MQAIEGVGSSHDRPVRLGGMNLQKDIQRFGPLKRVTRLLQLLSF